LPPDDARRQRDHPGGRRQARTWHLAARLRRRARRPATPPRPARRPRSRHSGARRHRLRPGHTAATNVADQPPATRATRDAARATFRGILLLVCLLALGRLVATAFAYGVPAWFD